MEPTIVPLDKRHYKKDFECGYGLLDNYIRTQARQDVGRDLSACFVLASLDGQVMGYYTLSANSIDRDMFPENLRQKLPPSYDALPTVLLGRLAMDNKYKGKGYGVHLLVDALKRCAQISEGLGSIAIIVDPIDEKARSFYEAYGFGLLPDSKKMFIPMRTVRDWLAGNG